MAKDTADNLNDYITNRCIWNEIKICGIYKKKLLLAESRRFWKQTEHACLWTYKVYYLFVYLHVIQKEISYKLGNKNAKYRQILKVDVVITHGDPKCMQSILISWKK